MSATGSYMALRFRYIGPVFTEYRRCVLEDIMRAFDGISDRARKASDAEYARLCSAPAGEDYSGDLSNLAEAAHSFGIRLYLVLKGLRQATLNLHTAGLFPLLEQQLADQCRDVTFSEQPPKDTKLETVTKWYRANFMLDLHTLRSWTVVDELRCAANTVKHGDGRSAQKLHELRPTLFQDAKLTEFELASFTIHTRPVRNPMSGEDLFITEDEFCRYAEAASGFMIEIADYFEAHGADRFL